jgi:hypothetical protein
LVRTIEKELEAPLTKDKEKRMAAMATKRKAAPDGGGGGGSKVRLVLYCGPCSILSYILWDMRRRRRPNEKICAHFACSLEQLG